MATKVIDKFELKQMLYSLTETIERECGSVVSPACDNDETGKLRAEALNELRNAVFSVREIASSIY